MRTQRIVFPGRREDRKMRSLSRKALMVILIVTLSISMLPAMTFAGTAEGTQLKYLYIGDSMSYNFANGRHKYTSELGSDGHYPAQIVNEMGYECLNKEGGESNQFNNGGIRTTDIYAVLSDSFDGDAYTKQEYIYLQSEKESCKQLVRDADVITVQLGHSNLSAYGLNRLLSTFDMSYFSDVEVYDNDISTIFTEEEITRTKPLAQRCIQKIALTNVQLRTLEKCIKKSVGTKQRNMLVKYFGESTVDTLENLHMAASDITDTLLYMLMSDMVHFDRMMECIYTLNPDAKVFVMGLFNPAPDLRLEYSAGKTKISLSLKQIAKPIFDLMNEYYRVYSEYSDKYYYVAPAKDVKTYGDVISEEGAGSEAMRQILTAYFSDKNAYDDISADATKAEDLVPIAMALAKKQTININEMLKSVTSIGQITAVLGDSDAAYDFLIQTFGPERTSEPTESDYIVGQAWLLRLFNGIVVHPSQEGHTSMANNLLASMKSPMINKDAIKYHSYDRLSSCCRKYRK